MAMSIMEIHADSISDLLSAESHRRLEVKKVRPFPVERDWSITYPEVSGAVSAVAWVGTQLRGCSWDHPSALLLQCSQLSAAPRSMISGHRSWVYNPGQLDMSEPQSILSGQWALLECRSRMGFACQGSPSSSLHPRLMSRR